MDVELLKEDTLRTCWDSRCHRKANFRSDTGSWCYEHLPLSDIPPMQLDVVIGWMALVDPTFQVNAEGEINLREE